jgi:hypothetical protein
MRHTQDADCVEIDVAPEFVCLSFIVRGALHIAALELENNQ